MKFQIPRYKGFKIGIFRISPNASIFFNPEIIDGNALPSYCTAGAQVLVSNVAYSIIYKAVCS